VVEEFRTPVDVLVLVERAGKLLFMKRAGTIYGSGSWALPSGRLEPDEDVVAATIRELAEELGIDVAAEDVAFVGVIHALPKGYDARVGFGFLVSRWRGEPTNHEPDKCSDLQWRSPDDLPDPVLPYTREIIRLYLSGEHFSRPGWPATKPDSAG
jgi:8-oxo-dGTP diphosphatase